MLIPLCVLRISTYLYISVCYNGSAEEQEEAQHGESAGISSHRAPTHTILKSAAQDSVLLVTVTCDDILIRRPLFSPMHAAHRFREPVQKSTTTLRIGLMAPGESGQGGGDATVTGRNVHQSHHRAAQYSRF